VVSLGIFSVAPPTEPCALRSTQPLKVSTRDFSWGKGGRCIWLTTYHLCIAETSRKSEALTYPEPLVPPRPVAGHLYFNLLYLFIFIIWALFVLFHILFKIFPYSHSTIFPLDISFSIWCCYLLRLYVVGVREIIINHWQNDTGGKKT
jgi:hypothetical protein